MYINFWYPVAKSDEINAEAPFRTQILGLNFVAFRDGAGTAHVLSDTCIHRGGALGKGKIKDGAVECPYHGWRFKGDGACARIPSLGEDAKIPPRAKVDSYPVQEKYGLVFAFLGDLPEEERPPLHDIPEYGQDGWRASELIVLDVPFYYERSVENGLDPAHNEFVHPAQGSPTMHRDALKKPIKIEDVPWGSKFFVRFNEEKKADTALQELRADRKDVRAGSGHTGPNQLITWISFSPTAAFHQYMFEAPVDDGRTRIYFLNMRNCMLDPGADEMVLKINLQVVHEDIDVLSTLNPVRTPSSNTKETLLPTDAPAVRYREYLREWDAKGWRIDFKALAEKKGDIAFAIPSPGRRTSGNWVLDAVPLVPAQQARKAAAE